MADVFISYKSNRRKAAEHLATIFARYGYTTWYDYSLIKGNDFDFQLDREVRAAKAVVVLWCSLSVESRWVSREAGLATKLETLLPVVIERCDLKLAHFSADYVNLTDWDGSPRSHKLDPLFRELTRLIGRSPSPDWDGLIDYEDMWRRFGAPTLQAFALDGVSAKSASSSRSTGAAIFAPVLDERTAELNCLINEFFQPIRTRIQKDTAIWEGIKRQHFETDSLEFRIALQIERDQIIPNHDAIVAIVEKWRHLLNENDVELSKTLDAYLKHVAVFKGIVASGDLRTYPELHNAPWPKNFYSIITDRLASLKAERETLRSALQ